MKVGIVGYGVEGKSAEAYWRAKGDEVTICDTNSDLTGYDLLVRSPGVHPRKLPQGAHVTSVTNEFMAQCPAPIIGVTGTKGKGTTCSLITEMLRAAGKTVHLGGNIGVPALDLLSKIKPDDVVVLELSSFQLMDAKKSPHVAVCLMIAPEHLDYHTDETEYWDAKGNIFAHQMANDVAIYNKNNQPAMDLAYTSAGQRIPYDVQGADKSGAYVAEGVVWYQATRICEVSNIALIGEHNQQNVCAALAAAWTITQDVPAITRAIAEFKGLPYRLQEVGVVGDVRYINDSFAVQPDAAVAAMRSFSEPKVVILGGVDRNLEYSELAKTASQSNVRKVLLIGQTAQQIKRELEQHDVSCELIEGGMKQILAAASHAAQAGDVVLLSPGCASFDMFKDYIDRGEQFTAAVKELRHES